MSPVRLAGGQKIEDGRLKRRPTSAAVLEFESAAGIPNAVATCAGDRAPIEEAVWLQQGITEYRKAIHTKIAVLDLVG